MIQDPSVSMGSLVCFGAIPRGLPGSQYRQEQRPRDNGRPNGPADNERLQGKWFIGTISDFQSMTVDSPAI